MIILRDLTSVVESASKLVEFVEEKHDIAAKVNFAPIQVIKSFLRNSFFFNLC